MTRYSFGDDAASLGEFGWYNGNSDGRTHVVGEKRPNGFGLFDMHGNVWEWCWDGFGEGYYKGSPPDDPRGVGGAANRVCRGGGWCSSPRAPVGGPAQVTRRTPGTATWASAWPEFSLSAEPSKNRSRRAEPGSRRPGRRHGGAVGRSPAGRGRSVPGGAVQAGVFRGRI